MEQRDRRYAKKMILEDKTEASLEWFGEGTSCICYKVQDGPLKGRIIKEFFPDPRPFLTLPYIRRSSAELGFRYVSNAAESDDLIFGQRYRRFLDMEKVVKCVKQGYESEAANMFGEPKKIKLLDGTICYDCGDLQGEVLPAYWKRFSENKPFRKRLHEALRILFRICCDLDKYHEVGMLNLDLKPDNLFFIRGDSRNEYNAIRNLDFGSCQPISEIIASLQNCYDATQGLSLFLSTFRYYPENEIRYAMRCCQSAGENLDAETALRRLDLIAVLNIFSYLVLSAEEEGAGITELLRTRFQESSPSSGKLLFEDYHIYHMIRMMILDVLNTDRKVKPIRSVKQLRVRIAEILSALDSESVYAPFYCDGTPEELEAQKCARLLNENYKSKNKLLMDTYRKMVFGEVEPSFAGLLGFCDRLKLRSPAELNQYLLMNGR